ncbi:proton-conducting transporter transmembrane domain-containing protein [Serinicoccus kebangsaanensis]|uniref:proton-conducting transporter transmembrane domain-containing protein n=1 Tax=Serinicoccus kebangsaanensis TaxID=2602069 RepID=UPI00124F4FFE|nr:proton-conducting transporter membrane subunit [Serinicoccus kebangsaanensis]
MRLQLDLVAVLPVLAPVLAAVLVLLVDVAVPGRRSPHLWLGAAGLLGGAAAALPGVWQPAGDTRQGLCLPDGWCAYAADDLTSMLQLGALLGALVVLVLAWPEWSAAGSGGGVEPTGRAPVVTALLLTATAGVVAVPAAGDLGSLLVSLELATLPTVVLVALVRTTWAAPRRARAVDGAVALLTTSLVSFGLLALGAGFWAAATGSTRFAGAASVDHPELLVLAAVLLVAGLAFKVSAVPFHAWTPITYAAAPLPVTTYLATVSKVAALGGLVVVVRALGTVEGTTLLAIALLAAASMTVGNLVALTQQDAVRLLAWSTVAQAGWVLLPLATLSSRAASAAGSYLVVYLVATLLAFVVVVAVAGTVRHGPVEDPAGPAAATALAAHRGLLRARPLLAVPLGLALLTLAGLPPAVAGVVAKVVALRPVLGDETWWLAVVAALNVALGIAVYLRWLVVLASSEGSPQGEGPAAAAGAGGDTDVRTTVEATTGPAVDVRLWVLVGLLTALLVLGSIVPLGTI